MNSPCIIRRPDGRYQCSVRGHIYKNPVLPIRCICGSDSAVIPNYGPGEILAGMFATLGIFEQGGCNCKNMAARMNLWGPDGCLENLDEILDHLEREAAKRPMLGRMPFRRRFAELLVRRAIRLARR